MNWLQRKAYQQPSLRTDGAPFALRYDTYEDGIPVSICLTVRGDPETLADHQGRAVWHCSIAIHAPKSHAIPLKLWTQQHRHAAKRGLARALQGVGDHHAPDGWLEGDYALHHFVPLTTKEQDGLNLSTDDARRAS